MMSIRGDFMRDNQPKISEAAAASLRSGEVEPGRGWSSLCSDRMATSILALTVRFQFLLVSCSCLLVSAPRAVWLQRTVPTLARPLPGAALSPRSSYFTSLSSRGVSRRATRRRAEVTRTN